MAEKYGQYNLKRLIPSKTNIILTKKNIYGGDEEHIGQATT
jgi:hypothetical protein